MPRDAIAALPLCKIDKKWHIVLITGRDSNTWIIPKGNPEKRMSSQEVASLEAFEEAGVMGKVKRFATSTKCRPTGGSQLELKIHPLIVDHMLTRWPEHKERKRLILPIDRAVKRITSKRLARAVRKLAKKTV
jgi:8-oxo-dGTP pyrophosphatase MutT (NUDIX family)